MAFCKICDATTDVDIDEQRGISCCVECGSVLEDVAFSSDVTFQKDAAGESTVVGQFVNESGVARGIGRIHGGRVYAYQAESHERAQQRGRQHIAHLVDQLKVKPREESIDSAHRVYKMALQKGFTRGRRTSHVAAACLYLLCRQDDKPFFLIDFSDILQVSVFSLGAVFLQLAKLLRLENQPQFTKPVDPSLYIHRFADKMGYADDMLKSVSQTAMRLVASMKRDWIQTGRRPSGVCGAALYIATHLHGNPRTKREIVNVVHIGEFTLSKRLNEFATTPAGGMNKQEFLEHSEMLERQEKMAIENAKGEALPENLIGGCCHVQQDSRCHFRQGLCKECYLTFVGCTGVYEGANPPSFSKNREKENKEMMEIEAAKAEAGNAGEAGSVLRIDDGHGCQQEDGTISLNNEEDIVTRRRSGRLHSSMTKAMAGGTGKDNGKDNGGADGGKLDQKECRINDQKRGKKCIDIATVQAAEQFVEGFDMAIAEAEMEDAKRRRKRISTSAIVATATRFAIEEAAVAVGEDRDVVIAAQGNSLPLSVVGDFAKQFEDGVDEEAPINDDLSDISDSEINQYIAEEEEVKCKEEIWNMMNQDWMEKQEAKKAAQAAALRAQEEQRLAMERAAAAGVQYKRGRGRPLGSKSKPKPNDLLPMAETPEEAAMRVIDDKKLSAKINYSVLQSLFEPNSSSLTDASASNEQLKVESDAINDGMPRTRHSSQGKRTVPMKRNKAPGPPPRFSEGPVTRRKNELSVPNARIESLQGNKKLPEKDHAAKAAGQHQRLGSLGSSPSIPRLGGLGSKRKAVIRAKK
jgi:transcription factor IIIB subunit 2